MLEAFWRLGEAPSKKKWHVSHVKSRSSRERTREHGIKHGPELFSKQRLHNITSALLLLFIHAAPPHKGGVGRGVAQSKAPGETRPDCWRHERQVINNRTKHNKLFSAPCTRWTLPCVGEWLPNLTFWLAANGCYGCVSGNRGRSSHTWQKSPQNIWFWAAATSSSHSDHLADPLAELMVQ